MARLGLQRQAEAEIALEFGRDLGAISDGSPVVRDEHGSSVLIVNDLIRPKVEQEVAVLSRRGADHVRTVPPGSLNRKGADPSGATVDQRTLARRKSRVIEEGLPDRERR